MRCDRNKPCESCIHRGEVANCNYAAATTTTAPMSSTSLTPESSGIHDRIGRLEKVVGSLVQELTLSVSNRMSDSILSPSNTQQSTESSVGRIQVKQNETNYVGGEHWAVIADTIWKHIVAFF